MRTNALVNSFVIIAWGFFCGPSWAAENETVLVSSGNVTITVEDIERYVEFRVPKGRQYGILASPEKIKDIANNLLTLRLMAADAEKANVALDESQLAWQAEYARTQALVTNYQDQYIQEYLGDVDFSASAKEKYIAEKDKYMTPERVDAAHILVAVNGDRSAEEAEALALDIRKKLNTGADFNDLAKQYSDDPSVSQNGGELGVFEYSEMVGPFSEKAFSLVEGEVSEPVKTRYGFHLIKLNKKLAPILLEFSEVEGEINQALTARYKALARESLVREASMQRDVELNVKALQALAQEYDVISK
ncbi:peptidylprolyl isomerase [Gilvimarinus xylanilyticus]|uniref:peptidylprolyl isomerase n=1 Tax=Gilvimarinus xylanilyticus TaxID=2944139 RepID=A0A9X2KTJ9_9GAMM|nr:peptidylprolyl isomerase [Gilvimarinus xylanilyticus]MCP8899369.1 peptidylprolyl isomerase [Gilvimarinus xylanilyticus]